MSLFGQKKSPFRESAAILAEEGFTDRYIGKLKEELQTLKKPADTAKGQSFLINGMIIKGDLTEAYSLFERCESGKIFAKLDKNLYPNLLHNVIFSLYIRDKFSAAERLYKEYNEIILSEHTNSMRRTLALHECMNKRFENAVTVLVKLLDSDCRFVDLCIVKAVLALEMFDRAEELSANFNAYDGKNELEKEARQLKKRIFAGLSPDKKVKMIKDRK